MRSLSAKHLYRNRDLQMCILVSSSLLSHLASVINYGQQLKLKVQK